MDKRTTDLGNVKLIDPTALQHIADGTTSETGERFFEVLVTHLASVAGTKCAWVTEWIPESRELRALSFWLKDRFVTDFVYPIANSPCGDVIDTGKCVHVQERLVELYPLDEDIKPLDVVSYLGTPLSDADGELLGHLAVMDDKPMPHNETAVSILNIFAARAAAELARLKRERAIREREQKLSRLFDGAMDAIVEFDADLSITNLNTAAARVFGTSPENAHGLSIGEFLSDDSAMRLERLISELGCDPEEVRSLWIPSGLNGVSSDGSEFPAEATISAYRTDGQLFYGLILRNIRERVEAEERLASLIGEAEYLRSEINDIQGFENIVGSSDSLKHVLSDVAKVAGTDASVLITGETGTGKELIARAIHDRSPRAGKPLITVNCAAISPNLQESEFFGHERGAFTGAAQKRDGRFKLAHGGTIFLDEVGEMSLDLQAKLLRVLQEGQFEPVGSAHTINVDVRVIAATNRDLEQMAREGTFRLDLLYRLNVFPLHLPPLRERGSDVIHLAESFLERLSQKNCRDIAPLTEAMKQRLLSYDWPGNVRELQNVMELAFITSVDGKTLNLDRALPLGSFQRQASADPPQTFPNGELLTARDLRELEKLNIERALKLSGGRISGIGGAAELMGIHANTLASRMKTLKIDRQQVS